MGPSALRILNVSEAPAGRRSVSLPGVELSVEPCARCDARCCRMRAVVSTVEALRIAAHRGVGLLHHVAAVPFTRELTTLYAWPFKLDDGGRHVFVLRRDTGACVHLEGARCGVYDLRPANCRLFPFVIDDDGDVLRAGSQERCPTQWLQDDDTRATVARDVARYREDRALELAVVRFWNRGRRERTLAGLVEWLEETVRAEVGRLGADAPR